MIFIQKKHFAVRQKKQIASYYTPLSLTQRYVFSQLLKIQKNHNKSLSIFEEFENKNPAAANSSKFRVHIFLLDPQYVTTILAKMCNFSTDFSEP